MPAIKPFSRSTTVSSLANSNHSIVASLTPESGCVFTRRPEPVRREEGAYQYGAFFPLLPCLPQRPKCLRIWELIAP